MKREAALSAAMALISVPALALAQTEPDPKAVLAGLDRLIANDSDDTPPSLQLKRDEDCMFYSNPRLGDLIANLRYAGGLQQALAVRMNPEGIAKATRPVAEMVRIEDEAAAKGYDMAGCGAPRMDFLLSLREVYARLLDLAEVH